MNIGVDIRPLMTKNKTGVGEYTSELLNAVFALDKTNQYYLFYNSYEDVSANIPKWEQDNVHYIATRWPNKLLNTAIKVTHRPRLDKLIIENWKLHFPTNGRQIGNLDLIYSPNLNFTSLSPNTKFVLTIHDLSFDFFPEFFTAKQRLWHKIINPKKQCERADVIITPSENTRRDIVDYYGIPAEKIRVIYPGLSSSFTFCHSDRASQRVEESLGIGERDPSALLGTTNGNYILFLGAVEPRKNIIGLIDAFEQFQKNYKLQVPSYKLIIAGPPGWKTDEIYTRAQISPCRDQIKFLGYVDPADKPGLYANASLFVYPSFYEGFGFPVLEAMASGTPVITSNRSSLPEITSTAAWLVDPNRPRDIADAMSGLLSGSELSANQTKNGLEMAAKFSWNTAAENWISLLTN